MSDSYTGVDNLEVMQEAKNYNRYLLNTLLKFHRGAARTLDFGAGSGQFVIPMAEKVPSIVALEPDAMLRDIIRSKGIRAVSGVDEIPDQSLEYIYSLNVLEHIQDDAAALRDLHTKLAPQGTLLIYVPAFPVLYSSMDAKVGHIRRYTRATLESVVVAAGFRVRHAAYVDSLGYLATLLFKLIGNSDGTVNMTALKLYDRLAFPISRFLDLFTSRLLGKNLLLVAQRQ